VACATDGHILIKTSVSPGCELPESLTYAPESYNKLKADISEMEASIVELESDIHDSENATDSAISNLKWKLADARKSHFQALSGVIVPKDACVAISKMDGCIIRLGSNCIEAATASQRLVHKLIEGTFPDYKRVIPPRTGNTCKVDRRELLDAINRMSNVVSSEKNVTPAVVFDWEDDQLSLSLGRQLDAGSDVLSAVTSGGARTAFSIRLIGRLLGAISSEMIEFDSGPYGAPVLVSSPGDDGLVAVVMPIRIDGVKPLEDELTEHSVTPKTPI
jgi:DNA polymerase III sliding clamp (beta) subunit (PCNA family)